MTASSLVTIDIDGNVIHPGFAPDEFRGKVNVAGYVIHSAIHEARKDAQAVLHSHHPAIVAVASSFDGLLPVGQAYYG